MPHYIGMLYTIGKEFNRGFHFPLSVHKLEDLSGGFPECFKLFFIYDGSILLKLPHGTTVQSSPAIILLSEKDSPEIESSKGFKGLALLMDPQLIRESFSYRALRSDRGDFSDMELIDAFALNVFLREGQPLSTQLTPDKARFIQGSLMTINKELTSPVDDMWPCKSRAELFSLLNYLNKLFNQPRENNNIQLIDSDDLPGKTLLYLHENIHRPITLEEIAKDLSSNRTSLGSQFKEATSMTIMEYLKKIRLDQAALLLRDTGLPVSQIMEKSGFRDLAHFSRSFKKYSGLSPSEYRRKFSAF